MARTRLTVSSAHAKAGGRGTARAIFVLLYVLLACMGLAGAAAAVGEPVRICATTPELGSLARYVGGDQVEVTVFAKGKEDPHFVDPKPSFVRALHETDLFIAVGMTLEQGWAPLLLQNARNSRIQPGAPGYVDASTVIDPLEVPTVAVQRSMGDVNPYGNPHYLLDPLNGLKVAALIRDKLIELRPGQREYFEARYNAFAKQLAVHLVGEQLAERYSLQDIQKLAVLAEHGKLVDFLKTQGQAQLLGGWLGMMAPYYGFRVVDDHHMYPYFAHRFGIKVIGDMEPIPGITPTTKHLKDLVKEMDAEHVNAILSASYYDPRHAHFLAHQTGAAVIPFAHQVGARPGTEDYLDMIDYDVKEVAAQAAQAAHGAHEGTHE